MADQPANYWGRSDGEKAYSRTYAAERGYGATHAQADVRAEAAANRASTTGS